MRFRIWLEIDGTRKAVGWTDSKRDAMATCRALPGATWEDTIDEED